MGQNIVKNVAKHFGASVLAITLLSLPPCCNKVHAQTASDAAYSATDLSPVTLEVGNHNTVRPDDHAPIGVMGDHTHKQGEWMFSYRYMYMLMNGNRDGFDDLSTTDVLKKFPVAPKRMHMHMHMLGAMYAPHDKVTLMASIPYITMHMSHVNRMGAEFETNAQGFGDLRTMALVPVVYGEKHKVILRTGASWPTGSIDQRDNTPMGRAQQLPYPMQLGSGTYDLIEGITYTGRHNNWSWGTQATGTIRLGKNDRNYRVGNRIDVTPWLARQWTPWVSTSVRTSWQAWGDNTGADSDLNPMIVQTARSDLQGGHMMEAAVGVNVAVPRGRLKGLRVAAEVGMPLYQYLRGPQLERDLRVTGGIQYAF